MNNFLIRNTNGTLDTTSCEDWEMAYVVANCLSYSKGSSAVAEKMRVLKANNNFCIRLDSDHIKFISNDN